MELSKQVVSLDLAKKLLQVESSRSILGTDETMPKMQKDQAIDRVLRTEEISLGERTASDILQNVYSQTSKGMVSICGAETNTCTPETAQKGQPRVLPIKASEMALGLKDSRYRGLRRQVRVLWGTRTEVLGNRPHEWRRERTQEDSQKQDYLSLAPSEQLSVRLPSALPQLQYGNRFLEGMPA